MHVVTSRPRPTRRRRRRHSLATLVRVLGSVQVYDHPIAWSTCSSSAAQAGSFSSATAFPSGRRAPGSPLPRG